VFHLQFKSVSSYPSINHCLPTCLSVSIDDDRSMIWRSLTSSRSAHPSLALQPLQPLAAVDGGTTTKAVNSRIGCSQSRPRGFQIAGSQRSSFDVGDRASGQQSRDGPVDIHRRRRQSRRSRQRSTRRHHVARRQFVGHHHRGRFRRIRFSDHRSRTLLVYRIERADAVSSARRRASGDSKMSAQTRQGEDAIDRTGSGAARSKVRRNTSTFCCVYNSRAVYEERTKRIASPVTGQWLECAVQRE